jgi:hypothetical protein
MEYKIAQILKAQCPDNLSIWFKGGKSEDVAEWLGGWLSGGEELNNPSDYIEKALSPYHICQHVTVYRGVPDGESLITNITDDPSTYVVKYDKPSSWTYDINMARNFSDIIITTTLFPDDILVDTTQLPPYFIESVGGWAEEREVIAKAKSYIVSIVT